jgi:hypothetical protein
MQDRYRRYLIHLFCNHENKVFTQGPKKKYVNIQKDACLAEDSMLSEYGTGTNLGTLSLEGSHCRQPLLQIFYKKTYIDRTPRFRGTTITRLNLLEWKKRTTKKGNLHYKKFVSYINSTVDNRHPFGCRFGYRSEFPF